MASTTTISIGALMKRTDKALLIALEGSGKEVWIPLSVIKEPDHDQIDEETDEIEVMTWFVKKEGLDD